MPAFLTLTLLRKVAPYAIILAAIVAFGVWVHRMQTAVATSQQRIVELQNTLSAEQAARKADVAGLTTLAQGLAHAATDTKRDATILQETISATQPQPASPGLAALVRCLHAADAGTGQCDPAARTGAAAAPATVSAGHH